MVKRYRAAKSVAQDPVEMHARKLYVAQMKIYSARIGRELDIPFDRLDPITKTRWLQKARECKSEILS